MAQRFEEQPAIALPLTGPTAPDDVRTRAFAPVAAGLQPAPVSTLGSRFA